MGKEPVACSLRVNRTLKSLGPRVARSCEAISALSSSTNEKPEAALSTKLWLFLQRLLRSSAANCASHHLCHLFASSEIVVPCFFTLHKMASRHIDFASLVSTDHGLAQAPIEGPTEMRVPYLSQRHYWMLMRGIRCSS